jgi:uncharacterized protein (TIGR03000 family)
MEPALQYHAFAAPYSGEPIMFRITIASVALVLLASVASAQPQPRQLPLAPGIMPGSPWGPGMPFVPAGPVVRPVANNVAGNRVFFPVAMPWGWGVGYGYQTFSPWTGFGYSYGGILPSEDFAPQPSTIIIQPPSRPEPTTIALANEFPATLTLQLPAAGEVWLAGKKVTTEKAEEQVLISPVLKPDQQYRFDVKARWTHDGKTYEAVRTITLNPGERSRLQIISGDEVRK